MKRITASAYAAMALTAAPAVAFAQLTTFKDVVLGFADVLLSLIPLITAFAVLVMIWGLAKFIGNAGDTKAHDDGRALIFWGTVGLFVMVTLWGILAVMLNEFEFGGLAMPFLPQ